MNLVCKYIKSLWKLKYSYQNSMKQTWIQRVDL